MIYKKYSYIFLLICIFFCSTCASAVEYSGFVKSDYIDYSKTDASDAMQKAESSFSKAIKETNIDKRYNYLQEAAANYYIVTKVNIGDIYSIVQLGRTYDLQGYDKYARGAFSSALGINPNDKFANYYFGDYYYFRKEYGKALNYYRRAFKNGLSENSNNLKKMAVIYEKLGDLKMANLYYKKTFLKDRQDEDSAEKIREIENIKYNSSDYYRRKFK